MNPKIILALSFLAVLLASNAYVAWQAFGFGKTVKQNEWNSAIILTTDKKLDTVEKQNEIRNSAIDNTTTDRRLLNGTF